MPDFNLVTLRSQLRKAKALWDLFFDCFAATVLGGNMPEFDLATMATKSG